MKLNQFVYPLILTSLLSLTSIGCKSAAPKLTQLPTFGTPGADADKTGNALASESSPKGDNIGQPHPDKYRGPKDDRIFAAYNVHFDYDSPVVKSSEKPKVAHVADYLKANPANGIEVAGHCDERGTDQYNFSLGEQRALAVREELMQMGIAGDRILTVSYGRTRPIDGTHSDTAHAKNRRDQFVLCSP